MPHPFEHGRERADYPLAELTVDVRVASVTGLPASVAEELTRAVTNNKDQAVHFIREWMKEQK